MTATTITRPAVSQELATAATAYMATAAKLAMLQDQQKAFRTAHRHEMAQHEDGQAADELARELKDSTKGRRDEIRALRSKARAYADGLEVGKSLAVINAQVMGLKQRLKGEFIDRQQELMPFMEGI